MSRALGRARPKVHRSSSTTTAAMARAFVAWPGGAAQAASRLRPQGVLLNRHLPKRPSPDGLPRHASRVIVIAAGTARWSHPYRPCPRRALAHGHEQAPAVNDGR